MFTKLACCVVLGASLLAQEPSRPLLSAAAESLGEPRPRCCAATERRLAKRRLPSEAREPALLRDIYRFVGSHLDLMTQLPCFCGCQEQLGHHSAADCFVDHMDDPTRANWSPHGASCGMCIGIARDAMTLHGQNLSTAEIRVRIDTKFRPPPPLAASSASPRKEMR
jgi:uncharacterized protein with PCYCGC motif